MKKIISLVLAVLMLSSMAVSASAVKILNSEGTGFIKSETTDKITISELLSIYEMLGLDLPYGGADNYFGETFYTWWYDDCPECGGFSFHYVNKGKIYWKCLETDCEKNGTIGSGNSSSDKDSIYSGVKCPECRSEKTIFIETVLNYAGNLRDRYYCSSCKEDFYTDATHIKDEDDIEIDDTIGCGREYCIRKAKFVKYYVSDGKLYARYKCAQGHYTDKRIYTSTIFDKEEYTVRVTCSAGGDYDIIGGKYANYGEKKTIEFSPRKGYVLTEVLVNGENVKVSSSNKIEITVKSNTVVRAYFEKVSKLKNYTLTAESSGNGSITAKKNGETVSADSIKATYADTVTYRFVPSSKNYEVSSLKINGKAVSPVSTYTVSGAQGNLSIDVTFAWDNPFCDVKESYENAVEYVTESGIMSALRKTANKQYFSGTVQVTVKDFAAALAEMADTSDMLDTLADRIAWAEEYGILEENAELNAACDVQTACELVRYFLEALEDINKISFVDLNYRDSVEETAIKIDLVSEATFAKNRKINRYDLASVCYLVAGLEYAE